MAERSFVKAAGHLLLLWNFAVAQPLYDVLGRGAEFLVVHQISLPDLILFLLFWSLLGALPFLLLLWLGHRAGQRILRSVLFLEVGVLGTAFSLLILKWGGKGEGILLLWPALLGGGLLAWGYLRFPAIPRVLTLLTPSILLFAGLFLWRSQALRITGEAPPIDFPRLAVDAPLFVLVFDELPLISLLDEEGRIDPVRYPNFARLAARSTWYANAETVSGTTVGALKAILTGRTPELDRLPILGEYPQNLFTLFGGSYQIWAREAVSRFCPDSIRVREGVQPDALPRGLFFLDSLVTALYILSPWDLSRHLPPVTANWRNFAPRRSVEGGGEEEGEGLQDALHKWLRRQEEWAYVDRKGVFQRFVQAIHPTVRRKRLYFLHLFLPHVPWEYLPSGKRYIANGWKVPGLDYQEERWGEDEWAVLQAYRRHLLQVGFVDRLLGQLLDRLEELDLLDGSLLLVVSDHGARFWPGLTRRGHSEELPADVLAVPLFLKAPNQKRGRVELGPVKTTDILRLIAEALSFDLPWESLPAGKAGLSEPTSLLERPGLRLSLQRKLTLFGSRTPWVEVLQKGPLEELIGRPVTSFPVYSDPSTRIEILNQGEFQRVDLRAELIPAQVRGRMQPAPESPRILLVALNGTIQATTRTLSPQEPWHFSALFPLSALRSGSNRLEVFLWDGKGGLLRPTQ